MNFRRRDLEDPKGGHEPQAMIYESTLEIQASEAALFKI